MLTPHALKQRVQLATDILNGSRQLIGIEMDMLKRIRIEGDEHQV